MRQGITALLALALAVPVATAPVLSGEAQAQTWAEREAARDREWNERRDRRYNRGRDRRDDYRWRGERDWDPSRSYRSGNYRERRISRNDQIYRGRDGRYYCRRNDGTTGLVVGAAAGGLLGGIVGGGDLLGVLLGGAGGALAGREIDKGNVRCR